MVFSNADSALAGIPLTNALCENRQFSLLNMFTLRPHNSAVVMYFPAKFAYTTALTGTKYESEGGKGVVSKIVAQTITTQ